MKPLLSFCWTLNILEIFLFSQLARVQVTLRLKAGPTRDNVEETWPCLGNTGQRRSTDAQEEEEEKQKEAQKEEEKEEEEKLGKVAADQL